VTHGPVRNAAAADRRTDERRCVEHDHAVGGVVRRSAL